MPKRTHVERTTWTTKGSQSLRARVVMKEEHPNHNHVRPRRQGRNERTSNRQRRRGPSTNKSGGRITEAPPKVRTCLLQESSDNGKARMDSEKTGKFPGTNLLFLSLRKGYETKLEVGKLGQQGRGKKSHQARTVCIGRSASIPGTRFGRTNDRILNDDSLRTCDDLR
jgi:hypothetical protein